MRVLFIGGTGNISTACVERALAVGHRVTILTRGQRQAPYGGRVEEVRGDRDDPAVLAALGERGFDVVANFLGFRAEQVERDLDAFGGRCGQYVFISTASAYMKPPRDHIITESTPLHNPFWQYSRDKIACEERLMRAHRETGYPVTIVRPSYTYGGTWIPSGVGGHGYTVVGRLRRGQPIISHGDGQALWVMTAADDFAVGFVGLFGQVRAIGEAFHITSDEALTWDTLYRTIARAAGVEPEIVHIPSEFIAAMYPRLGPGLIGDKTYSVVFDNNKIRRLVPEFTAPTTFAAGVARSLAWHDADPARQVIDEDLSRMMDRLIERYRRCVEEARPTPGPREPQWV
jgi:nucleoside-diphosphate-sugar epimerase